MKSHTITILICILSSISLKSLSQPTDSFNFNSRIKEYDLSTLWRADSLLLIEQEYDSTGKLIHYKQWMTIYPEPLGFIGNTYQRFFIHFLSVKKNPKNPYQYIVTGKTKVNSTICKFTGTITITKSKLYKGDFYPKYNQGTVYCECKFSEDSAQSSSGVITGKLETDFYLDSRKNIFYDNLDDVSDGYCNNQFIGTWKSNKTKVTKKCHWGDYRIPDSGDLDEGAGEFSPFDAYLKFGWQSYRDANWNSDSVVSKKAKLIENEQWWK